jgi:hypothetical protein
MVLIRANCRPNIGGIDLRLGAVASAWAFSQWVADRPTMLWAPDILMTGRLGV